MAGLDHSHFQALLLSSATIFAPGYPSARPLAAIRDTTPEMPTGTGKTPSKEGLLQPTLTDREVTYAPSR
jgi:hypothetical protein